MSKFWFLFESEINRLQTRKIELHRILQKMIFQQSLRFLAKKSQESDFQSSADQKINQRDGRFFLISRQRRFQSWRRKKIIPELRHFKIFKNSVLQLRWQCDQMIWSKCRHIWSHCSGRLKSRTLRFLVLVSANQITAFGSRDCKDQSNKFIWQYSQKNMISVLHS